MGCLGNVIWFLCGGLWQGLAWTISGIFWCITIIGIPIGRQCFKFTALTFFPFGKEIQYGGNAISTLANLVWLIISGIPLAITACINGILLCCTIIGIPLVCNALRLQNSPLCLLGRP